jgi:hypothetical protein
VIGNVGHAVLLDQASQIGGEGSKKSKLGAGNDVRSSGRQKKLSGIASLSFPPCRFVAVLCRIQGSFGRHACQGQAAHLILFRFRAFGVPSLLINKQPLPVVDPEDARAFDASTLPRHPSPTRPLAALDGGHTSLCRRTSSEAEEADRAAKSHNLVDILGRCSVGQSRTGY